MSKTLDRMKLVRAILENGWASGTYVRDKDGNPLLGDTLDPAGRYYCVSGACAKAANFNINRFAPRTDFIANNTVLPNSEEYYELVSLLANELLVERKWQIMPNPIENLQAWNDWYERSQEDVLGLVDTVIRKMEENEAKSV